MASTLIFQVEILGRGYPEENYNVLRFVTSGIVPHPGSFIKLMGPKRVLADGFIIGSDSFIARAEPTDFIFSPETDDVIIRLRDRGCLDHGEKIKDVVKQYLEFGWKEM